ncbi:lysine--tRNA ligase, partial [Candidatus Bathyarchaeota archaeon]|nr:lysine--tRNA ligase [Candidatus Bathyarchaeota archaeon]
YNPGTGEIRYKCPNPSCKHEQVTTIDEARVKLNWRVDWPAKWSIFNTSCEPAGKDHSVKGGSYDTGLELCKEIFGYEGPLKLSYEWLRLGDQDMSTSGGIVFNPREYLRIGGLPEAFRHLILKTRPTSHISFRVEYLPQMQDEYERFERVYFGFEEVPDEELQVIKYLFPIVQPVDLPKKLPLRIPFKYAVVMAQVRELLDEGTVVIKCNEMARRSFPGDSPGVLERENVFKLLDAAKYWVEHYAPKHYRFNVTREPDEGVTSKLNEIEKKALRMLHEFIVSTGADSGEDIQNQVFNIAKEQLEVSPKKVFQAIYKVFVGKKHGPRLGPFLEAMDKKFIIKRLEASYTKKE